MRAGSAQICAGSSFNPFAEFRIRSFQYWISVLDYEVLDYITSPSLAAGPFGTANAFSWILAKT